MRYWTHNMKTGKMIHVYPIEECIEAIEQRYEDMKDSIERLQKENKKLKDEQYKDEELQKMKAKVESMQKSLNRGFSISEKEQEQINQWKKQHERDAHGLYTLEDRLKCKGTIGGSYTYEFIPTSVGTIGIIKCTCGKAFTFAEI